MIFCQFEPRPPETLQLLFIPSPNEIPCEQAQGSLLESEKPCGENGLRHAHTAWSRDEPCGLKAYLEILWCEREEFHCLSPWKWVGPTDSLLMNMMTWNWLCMTSEARSEKIIQRPLGSLSCDTHPGSSERRHSRSLATRKPPGWRKHMQRPRGKSKMLQEPQLFESGQHQLADVWAPRLRAAASWCRVEQRRAGLATLCRNCRSVSRINVILSH